MKLPEDCVPFIKRMIWVIFETIEFTSNGEGGREQTFCVVSYFCSLL